MSAVRSDRGGAHPAVVAPHDMQLFAGVEVPDSDCSVVAAGDRPLAVGGDCDRCHGAVVAGQGAQLPAGIQIPYPRSLRRCRPEIACWPSTLIATAFITGATVITQPCACRKPHPCGSGGMPILVEDPAETLVSSDVRG